VTRNREATDGKIRPLTTTVFRCYHQAAGKVTLSCMYYKTFAAKKARNKQLHM